MPASKNVISRTTEGFFSSFGGEENIVLSKQNAIAIIYKLPKKQLTVTIFRTTRSVAIKGKEEYIKQHVIEFQKMHESNRARSSKEPTQPNGENAFGAEAISPAPSASYRKKSPV